MNRPKQTINRTTLWYGAARRANTRRDVVVALASTAVLLAVLVTSASHSRMVDGTAQDRWQQSDIYASMLLAAGQNPGQRLPTPGLVNRLAADGQQVPGAGLEDVSRNNSKNLWSHCIMDSIVTPSQLIGPTEISPIVLPDTDYDYSKYNPAADVFWDDSFSAQISGSGGAKCNTSFANLAVIGLRKRLVWWRPYAPTPGMHAVLGTRSWQISSEANPMNGDAYTKSPTLLLHGPPNRWFGNIVYIDGHAELEADSRGESTFTCGNAPVQVELMHLAEWGNDGVGCFPSSGPGAGPGTPNGATSGDTWLGIFPNNVTATAMIPAFDMLLP